MKQPTAFRRSLVHGILGVCLVTGALDVNDATAQATLEQWPGLTATRLQTVYVRDGSGQETRGGLLGFTRDALWLVVDGNERRFDRADVTRLQTRDSLRNGARIGAVIGVVLGAVAAGISDCPAGSPGGTCHGLRAAAFATGVGVYTALGTAVDAAIRGRSTLYELPAAAKQSRAGDSGPRPLLRIRATW